MTGIQRISKTLTQAGIDAFLLLLIAAVILAWLHPEIGARTGPLSLSSIAKTGISAIFFFYGLRLNREKLRIGISNIRLHILIHTATFLLFPLITLSIRPLFHSQSHLLIWTGVFYLAALPSTVSSSVVMVSIAGGNIPAAIFNASISSLLGVIITPLWITIAVHTSQTGMQQLWPVIWQLSLQIILPVAAGILLNRYLGAFAEKHRRALRMFDQSIILLIVYTSFSTTFTLHLFSGAYTWVQLAACTIGMLLLFTTVYATLALACRLLRITRADRITALFCGSKKSLVHGTAMSSIIFSGHAAIGIILLPIMLYHAMQLIIVSVIAKKMNRRTAPTTESPQP